MSEKTNNTVNAAVALRTISSLFPLLDLNYLTYFQCVYYPIATIEAGVQQETLEDFTMVELNLLRLINSGCRDVEILSRLMGLTTTYVSEVVTILQDYQHLDENLQLTARGQRSLELERNIRQIESRQLFEVDAVNGYPLQPDQTISTTGQKTPNMLQNGDVVMLGVEQVTDTSLLNEFEKGFKRRETLRYRQAVNINVRGITEPQLEGLKYGCGFLMILEGQDPLLFVNINTALGRGRKRVRWQPLAVTDEQSAALLEWDEPLFFNERGRAIFDGAVREVKEKAQSDFTKERFSDYRAVVTRGLFLADEGLDEVLPQVFCVRREAFTRLTKGVLRTLSDLGSVNNVSVYLKARWKGNLVKFVRDINDRELAYVCQRLKYEVAQSDFDTVLNLLNTRLAKDKDYPPNKEERRDMSDDEDEYEYDDEDENKPMDIQQPIEAYPLIERILDVMGWTVPAK